MVPGSIFDEHNEHIIDSNNPESYSTLTGRYQKTDELISKS